MSRTDAIKVNRAPVLTLWAAVVAMRLGHPEETAFSLASAVAGTAARAKARRLGMTEDPNEGGQPALKGSDAAGRRSIRLLGRQVSVVSGEGGILLAADREGTGAKPGPVHAYVTRAFGPRLGEVRAAMERLAGRYEPEELNGLGFHLYEAFRPDVPEGVRGWGAKGELRLADIEKAGETSRHPPSAWVAESVQRPKRP